MKEPFTDCISETNNTEIVNAKHIDVVMPMHNFIEYLFIRKHQKICDNITEMIQTIIFKIKITGKTPAAGNIKDVEIAVPLKYLSNFWRTLEMPLINCKINIILTWSEDCYFFCHWSNKV